MSWLQRLWARIRAPFLFLKPIRFVVIPLAALTYALIWADEGQDTMRALVEFTRECAHWGRVLGFEIATFALALQAWYWSRQLLRIDFPECVESGDEQHARAAYAERHPLLDRYTPRIMGVIAFLIPVAGLLRIYTEAGDAQYTRRVIVVTIGGLLLGIALFLAIAIGRRKLYFGGAAPKRVASHDELAPFTRMVLHATMLIALAFIVFTAVAPVTVGKIFPSPPLLMLSAALWVGVGSWLVYRVDFYRVPLIGGLVVLAIAFSPINDNHSVRRLPAAPLQRTNIATTFDGWYRQLTATYGGGQRVYVVATEGGGVRAAYWTAAVLTELQDQAPSFSDHLFAISSVSGGSIGASMFTALVADAQRQPKPDDCDARPADPKSYRYAARHILGYDFLAPTLASLLHADLAQRFLPIGFIPDRQRALEKSWEAGWASAVGEPSNFYSGGMLSIYAARRGTLLPSLFLNGTVVEQGNRTIASNCLIDPAEVQDAHDTFNTLGSDMPLSTAAGNSARFTYVSPAGTIHDAGGKSIEHVVDGGYFENSGAVTAADIIRVLNTRNVPVTLIVIRFDAVPTRCAPDETPCPLPQPVTTTHPPAAPFTDIHVQQNPVPPERFATEVLSPVNALLATRGARGTLAVAQTLNLPITRVDFILGQTDRGVVLPLGWLLAGRTREAIDMQVGVAEPSGLDPYLQAIVKQNVEQVKAIAAALPPQPNAAPTPTNIQSKALDVVRSKQ